MVGTVTRAIGDVDMLAQAGDMVMRATSVAGMHVVRWAEGSMAQPDFTAAALASTVAAASTAVDTGKLIQAIKNGRQVYLPAVFIGKPFLDLWCGRGTRLLEIFNSGIRAWGHQRVFHGLRTGGQR